ncbi:MAG: hypothetical protein KGL59_03340 [Acidobacteriota bacterium]|nr:hypothetical protein [Acidobacteriota bacterium]
MKLSKFMIVFVAVASLGFGVSAMAQGRPTSHPGGGPGMGGPGMGAPGTGGPGMAGPSDRMGQPGSMGRSTQMGQNGQMGTQSNPKSASQLLTQNTKLASNLASAMGVDQQTLLNDASGYKNLGLFVAAVHVSKNLNIPFNSLNQTLSSNGENLGKAIHTLQPDLSKKQVKQAVGTAKRQAKTDIKQSKA